MTPRRGVAAIPSLVVFAVVLLGWQLYAIKGNLGSDVLPSPARAVSQG
jgi:ABC-type nitrate/sulfonate/bicarbonate transport system permease component